MKSRVFAYLVLQLFPSVGISSNREKLIEIERERERIIQTFEDKIDIT